MLNLHAMRLFHHVAKLGSVTKAADQLRISQPAVTSQIKKLERELGLKLLSSQGRGILLTDVGSKLAEETARLFALERNIEETLEEYKLGNTGRLQIAATYLPANFLLPHWIASYKRQYPGIDVQFTTTSSVNAVQLLLHYEADIAFIGGVQQSHPHLEKTLWREDEMWFVAHKDHRLAAQKTVLAEVVKEAFVYREKGSFSREQLLSLCRIHQLDAPEVGLQMNGFSELIRVVSDGYGIAFLSAAEARDEVDRGTLRRIYVTDVKQTNPVCLYHRREPLQPSARRFLELREGDGRLIPPYATIQLDPEAPVNPDF
ncbi:LysR family transcriptional regulator [Cohnella mopanensis]|uniref:LysR family transcriptional regulator n=1 Tax=Cohnella mopanensis TaxID=2911966 RepID=UPI001EF8C1FB|nr:LysR family transcriptional regulator [Cohnella mopanensis]